MRRVLASLLLVPALFTPGPVFAQEVPPAKLTAETVRGLELRGIGPALTPGRIADVAVDPRNRSVWYVATASSGLWKTRNRSTTWESFDNLPTTQFYRKAMNSA